ncbi:Epithelial-stromal interaction protein 1 [Liparis tanakae]|uniref:Epithelial-stromal interaction protein 1 n=1 Tax=Liparis tanakae TaxID=230148 RepID=A0A4Z2IPF0_9TELE|nr:Epithelial-stromal interaction protein 1 [Liparis tanakae]
MEHNQRDANKQASREPSSGGPSGAPGCERTPEDPNRDSPDSGNPQPTGREPQYSAGYTMIPPNASKRDQLLRDAQKEEEDCKRWKEANRVHAVHTTPETLGGSATLSEARERQQTDLRYSKQQKMLKKKDLDMKKRLEEEEVYQKMKDIQREKRYKVRRELDSFYLDRVNQAFLDNLEGQPGGSVKETKEGFGHPPWNPPGQQLTPAQLNQHPDQSSSDCWTHDADPDYDWALEKLMTSFPDYNRAFLEDILDQCSNDCEQAFTLLNIS